MQNICVDKTFVHFVDKAPLVDYVDNATYLGCVDKNET